MVKCQVTHQSESSNLEVHCIGHRQLFQSFIQHPYLKLFYRGFPNTCLHSFFLHTGNHIF